MDLLSENILVKQILEPETYDSGNAMTFPDIDIQEWSKALVVVNVGTWNDSDSKFTLTLKNDAVSPTSDAVSSDTFSWDIQAQDSDDDEVWLCDMDFGHLGLTKRYLSFAATALNNADSVAAAAEIILYERNGLLPVSQDHTVKNEHS